MSERRKVQCGTHGTVGSAYVCCHLVRGDCEPLGFNEPEYDPDDTEGQAWCDKCEEVLEAHGEWNQASEAFANIRLVCEFCFAAMRERNFKPRAGT
jgi:hypothetical protein